MSSRRPQPSQSLRKHSAHCQLRVDVLHMTTKVLQLVLPRRALRAWYRHVVYVSEKTRLTPSSLTLGEEGVQEPIGPLYLGGSAEIYRGRVEHEIVAVKRFRLSQENQLTTVKRFIREALIMDILRHPRILSLHSITYQDGCPSILTTWQMNGNIVEYLFKRPDASREVLVAGIVEGLVFLKLSGVIHGDLKGHNIVIDDNGAPCIADFGLSFVDRGSSLFVETSGARTMVSAFASDDIRAVFTADIMTPAYTRSGAGSLRWMPPELLVPEAYNKTSARPTFESDIFSFGMLVYEIYSGLVPFQDDTSMVAMVRILDGQRPPRPHQIPDGIWRITQKCWVENPGLRPSIRRIQGQSRP